MKKASSEVIPPEGKDSGKGSSTDKLSPAKAEAIRSVLHEKVRKYRDMAAEAIRSVFQGNRVSDGHNDHAIFAELGSSPASMEAAKVIDVFGSQPGHAKQQADARQAYTQALFKGVET